MPSNSSRGDLTTAFDFKQPEAWRRLSLPSTEANEPEDLVRHPDEVPVPPTKQALPHRSEHELRSWKGAPAVPGAPPVCDLWYVSTLRTDDAALHNWTDRRNGSHIINGHL